MLRIFANKWETESALKVGFGENKNRKPLESITELKKNAYF